MSIKKELFKSFLEVLPDEPSVVVIHSSFSRLLPPKDFNYSDALYSIKELVNLGWTIALPSFTFSYCKSGEFSYKKTKSETGIYADWVQKEIGKSYRTKHPIYSFVIVGEKANLLETKEESTWGEKSIFSIFENINAKLVMLGCDWQSCTQIHRYEEINKVPYRYFKYFNGKADFGDGYKSSKVKMYVRNLDINPFIDMNLLKDKFESANSYKYAKVFRDKINCIDTKDLALIANKEIQSNSYVLVRKPLKAKYYIDMIKESFNQPITKVAVLGHSNLTNLEKTLAFKLKKYIPERRFDFYQMSYGQFAEEILINSSGLNQFQSSITIFTSNINEIYPLMKKDKLEENINTYIKQISHFNEINKGWKIIFKFYLLKEFSSNSEEEEYLKIINQLNKKLEEHFSNNHNILWIDINNLAISSSAPVQDKRLWYLGKFPFSKLFDNYVSEKLCSYIIASLGKSIRAIVLDLDNTIWGGILGEDGLEGLSIDGDYPGNAFNDFQEVLLKFHDRGVALTIASKNDEDLAIKAIKNSKMPLSFDKFSTHRISWKNKYESIQEIAKELNLGLDHLLFIDDNPIEREQVSQLLPEVRILDLPSDPVEFTHKLVNNPYTYSLLETLEDKKRISSFKELKEIKKREFDQDNYENYLSSLDMKVHFKPLSNENLNRASQLCQKTNQFNTTAIRYSADDLQQIDSSGGKVIVIGLESKNSQFENIGLIVITKDRQNLSNAKLKLYLLSCRVLGRGIEKLCLSWIIDYTKVLNFRTLTGKLIKNNKNLPVQSLFNDFGFQQKDNNNWIISTKENNYKNNIFTIIDHFKLQTKDLSFESKNMLMRKEKLNNIIVSVLNIPKNDDLISTAYGKTPEWDSMAQFQLISEIEEAFGIKLTSQQLEDANSYLALLEIINEFK